MIQVYYVYVVFGVYDCLELFGLRGGGGRGVGSSGTSCRDYGLVEHENTVRSSFGSCGNLNCRRLFHFATTTTRNDVKFGHGSGKS